MRATTGSRITERGHDTHASEHFLRHTRAGRRRRSGRRAVAVLVVLLLIAVTLAVSYATVRSEVAALLIHQNANLGTTARQAAFTGITIGLKQMQTGRWSGVDSTLSGSLGNQESYQVTFLPGDASLGSGDPDYAELPYRVTLLATGQAVDAADATRITTHRIRVVVRLVPRNLGSEPVDWGTMQNFTVYQSKVDRFEVDIPCRITGPVRAQGTLTVARHYPNDDEAWDRYLNDLNAMRTVLQKDDRPFSGPIQFPFLAQTGKQLSGLANKLGVMLYDMPPQEAAADFTQPVLPSSYQVYQGGPVYTIPRVLTNPLENVTLEADPLTNPLGLFYRELNLSVRDNVTIRGSLISSDDVNVEGTNVHFEPVELPPLYGSDAPVRLPVVVCRSFHVRASAGGNLTGLLAAFHQFQVSKSSETVAFLVTGRIIARKFCIKERQPWELENWSSRYNAFIAQLDGNQSGVAGIPFFPLWMAGLGRNPQPLIRIVPDPSPVDYRWKMSYDTIFLPYAGDASPQDPNNPGLRWDLLEWTDRP